MKRALIITYYWPPSGGGGVQRWLKFAQHLRASGWEPWVVVPEGASYPVQDKSLMEDIPPDLQVLKVPIWEPFGTAQKLLGKKATDVERLGATARPSQEKRGWGRFITRWIRGNVFIPDARMLWVRPASQAIVTALREQPVDVLITTGPPHSVHLIGRRVQAQLAAAGKAVPWVADFRDPWSNIDYLNDFHLTAWARRRQRQLEQRVVRACDRLLVTAPGAARGLLGKDNVLSDPQVWWSPNGWDAGDLPQSKTHPTQSKGTFSLAHFGSLYASRDFSTVWKGIAKWNENHPDRPIRLELYGNTAPEVQASLHRHMSPGDFVVHGHLPHKAAVSKMTASDGLLLLHNDTESGRDCIPGKLFEYLVVQRPLLAVGPDPGDLAWMIREELRDSHAEAPVYFSNPADDAGIEAALASMVTPSEAKTWPQEGVARFERKALAADLATRLDELLLVFQNKSNMEPFQSEKP